MLLPHLSGFGRPATVPQTAYGDQTFSFPPGPDQIRLMLNTGGLYQYPLDVSRGTAFTFERELSGLNGTNGDGPYQGRVIITYSPQNQTFRITHTDLAPNQQVYLSLGRLGDDQYRLGGDLWRRLPPAPVPPPIVTPPPPPVVAPLAPVTYPRATNGVIELGHDLSAIASISVNGTRLEDYQCFEGESLQAPCRPSSHDAVVQYATFPGLGIIRRQPSGMWVFEPDRALLSQGRRFTVHPRSGPPVHSI